MVPSPLRVSVRSMYKRRLTVIFRIVISMLYFESLRQDRPLSLQIVSRFLTISPVILSLRWKLSTMSMSFVTGFLLCRTKFVQSLTMILISLYLLLLFGLPLMSCPKRMLPLFLLLLFPPILIIILLMVVIFK